MKHLSVACFLSAVSLAFAQQAPDNAMLDPTRSSPRMKAALTATNSAIPEMIVRGIVMAGGRDGAVMFEVSGGGLVLARPQVPFTVTVDGTARRLIVRQVSADGIAIEAPAEKETGVIPSFGPTPGSRTALPGEVEYIEFRDLPLLEALRMLADQTGQNYSASISANKTPINALLRHVPASSVIEEICKSHNLWFKRDELSGITRIMSVSEFEKDLVGFREEQTQVFTLKYPNVSEVAVAIADLFGDRVKLSLGSDDLDDEMRDDLESRFDRFDVLNFRTQTAGTFGNNTVGSGVNGFANFGGNSFGQSGSSNGSSFGNNGGGSRSSSYRRRFEQSAQNQNANQQSQRASDAFQNLTPEQAQRLEKAVRTLGPEAEGDASVQALRQRPATIFITASRRNNTVVVRTADPRVLDDIRDLVRKLDVQTPLVLLEVKILSVELGKGFRSVFDYEFKAGDVAGSFVAPLRESSVGAGAGFNGGDMTFTVISDNFRARLQLLEEKNRVKNLATPLLLTANNEVSRLFLGEERPVVRNISSQTIITDNNVATTPTTTTEFRPVGTTLLITPNINSDRTVTLRLLQENSFINPGAASIPVVTNNRTGSSGVQDVKVDVVATRSVSGTFVAKDKMAVAIGGLIEDENSNQRAQVPFLGGIPLLGTFFRREDRRTTRRELIIMIRPHVMSTPADGERISVSLLNELSPPAVERLVEGGFLPPLRLVPDPVPTRKAKPAAPKKASTGKKTLPPK